MKRVMVRRDSYYDSVVLMLISTEVKKMPGITEAVVAMGTEMNRDLIADMGLCDPEMDSATANDLIIAVEADEESAVEAARSRVDELLSRRGGTGDGADDATTVRPATIGAALRQAPESNLAIVSLPGRFAAREARRALQAGLHVMLFSDSVPVEEEVSLKRLAVEKGLLMMGPDCGTAIVNGHPVCFANVVPRGPIGIVAASGTGLQEVACAIAKAGSGVSQALGTGGRDLREEAVGGMMTLHCIRALADDAGTEVIVVISKPPSASLTPRVIEALKRSGKPAIVHFVGSEPAADDGPVRYAANLTQAARQAVAVANGDDAAGTEPATGAGFDAPDDEIEAIITRETGGIAPGQKYLRGLFTGGTLTDEAVAVLTGPLGGVHSFDASDPKLALRDPHVSQEHTIVDLGEDAFTVGRPHPMIDPSIRTERLDRQAEDPQVALLLLDCVLGYGSHPDPAGAMVSSIQAARDRAAARGGYLPVVVSITGTEGDPQGLDAQRTKLEAAGCVVMPTNHQAALLALRIMEGRT